MAKITLRKFLEGNNIPLVHVQGREYSFNKVEYNKAWDNAKPKDRPIPAFLNSWNKGCDYTNCIFGGRALDLTYNKRI